MKRFHALLTALILLSLSLLSCAQPSAQEEATPAPSQTPTAQPIAAPTPEPEPDYDSIVLPEPKSEKWESYERIIFTLSDLYRENFPTGVETSPQPKLGELEYKNEITDTRDIFCGVYPFTDETNGFLYQVTDLRPDDMVYVELSIYNRKISSRMESIVNARREEIEARATKDSRRYYRRLKSYVINNSPDPSEEEHSFWLDDDNKFFCGLFDNNCFGNAFLEELRRGIYGYDDAVAEFDRKWEKKHGDLSAKQYHDDLFALSEFQRKVIYSFYSDEIEYYNEQGCDLYLYYEKDRYPFNGYIDYSPTLRGFMPVRMITDKSFKCYDSEAYYTLTFPIDFPAAYGVATADDIRCTEEDYEKYMYVMQANRGHFMTLDEVDKILAEAESGD